MSLTDRSRVETFIDWLESYAQRHGHRNAKFTALEREIIRDEIVGQLMHPGHLPVHEIDCRLLNFISTGKFESSPGSAGSVARDAVYLYDSIYHQLPTRLFKNPPDRPRRKNK